MKYSMLSLYGEWPLEEMSWTVFDKGYCRCSKCVEGAGEVNGVLYS